MRLKATLFFCFFSICSFAQKKLDSITYIAYYKSIIKTLADDSMMGREVSSVYEDKAAKFIVKEFKKNKKFKPVVQPFKYIHPDSLIDKNSKNVYCFINNHSDSTILIGAHYDHIGLGGKLSYSLGKKNQIHNGADDNASGVALMLGLAKSFQQWQNKKYNYLFVAYSAHEIGLYGSSAFYEFSKNKFPPICNVINFDMVGRLNSSYPIINIYGMAEARPSAKKYIDSLATLETKIYTDAVTKINDTDCRVFVQKNIKSLSFTTGTHSDYHKISDDEDKINYQGILYIQNFLQRFFVSTLLK